MKNMNSHRFTGTKMFNRQAGDGLILVVWNIIKMIWDRLLMSGNHLTHLVISALSKIFKSLNLLLRTRGIAADSCTDLA